jgi:cytidine deaminase
MDPDDLIDAARNAYATSYAPYSDYPVGAAIETTDGAVYTGCNIENANFSNSMHAEEVAIATAVTAGHLEFSRLAVASAREDGVTPCGMCRQTLAEFCEDDFPIYCDEGDTVSEYALGDLIPNTISPETLA